MFCHKCGAQIAEGASFCHKCGTKAVYEDTVQKQQTATATITSTDNTQLSPDNSTKVKTALLNAATIGRILMYGSLFILFWGPSNYIIFVFSTLIGSILSYLGEKRPLKLSKKIELAIDIVILVVVIIISASGGNDKYVQMVKNGTLEAYPQIEVGKAFDSYLKNPKWESGLSDDDIRFVNVTGKILYYDKEVEIVVQFIVDEKNESFEYHSCEINDVPQSTLVFWALLEKVYEDY